MDGYIQQNEEAIAETDEVEGLPEDDGSMSDRDHQDSRLYKKVMAFNLFIDETAKGLTDGEFKVWCALYRFENNGLARASKKTIGVRVGKSERQVSRYISGLIRKGVLDIAKKGGSNGRCNEYRLGVKTLPALPRRRKSKPKPKPKPR
jgi:hypothetical protein